jgi:thioesterase domain-containing protein
MGRIYRQFGQVLPLSTLLQQPTVEALARLLQGGGAELPSSPLVALQPSGSKRPFFCVHPVGGQVLCYLDLARHLGPEQPFYGLQAPGLAEAGDRLPSIEEMAGSYVKELRAAQPQGPYLLGGWSMGGIVAFEMSQQLRREGQEVALLAMLDTWAPTITRDAPDYEDDDAFLLAVYGRGQAQVQERSVDISPDDFRRLGPVEQLELLKRAGLVPADVEIPYARRFLEGFRARQKAMRQYLPHVYGGRITVYRAMQVDEWLREQYRNAGVAVDDPALGWSELSTEPVESHPVPGPHEKLCAEPYVQALARRLQASINEACAG